jgi:predicted nucleotidyltransferase/DNA-binding XRE family transcriptional regulator
MTVACGSVLRDARLGAGLSQTELARRAGVTQSVISAYECGHREPALSTLMKLVDATGHHLELNLVAMRGIAGGIPDTQLGRRLRRHRRAVIDLAERYGAINVCVFGSAARGTDTKSSDIDLLVDLDAGVGVVSLLGLERELAELLGRKVDVVPAGSLKPAMASRVLAEAIPL